MKIKKILVSASLALTALLTGLTFATSTANAGIFSTKKTTTTVTSPAYETIYQNTNETGTVTTTTDAPTYTVFQEQDGNTLPAGTTWKIDQKRVNVKNGQVYYRVATNEYVSANDVTFN
jgi:hypothetical protein